LEPTAVLEPAERTHFDRLIETLRRRGVAERVDVAAVTTLSRLEVAIDKGFTAKPFAPKALSGLINNARGIRRELGLSMQSSRIMTRTSPELPSDARAYWRAKLGGES
jgi:hypothetical protein